MPSRDQPKSTAKLLLGAVACLAGVITAILGGFAWYVTGELSQLQQSTAQTLLESIRAELTASYDRLDQLLQERRPRYRALHEQALEYLRTHGRDAPLAPLKQRLEAAAGMPVDIYLINPNLVVNRTTYPPDEGLSFSQPALRDARVFVEKAHAAGGIVVQPPVLEMTARQLRIYTYSPIGNDGSTLELGLVSPTLNRFFNRAEKQMQARSAYSAELYFLLWEEVAVKLSGPPPAGSKQQVIQSQYERNRAELERFIQAARSREPVRQDRQHGSPLYYIHLMTLDNLTGPAVDAVARVTIDQSAVQASRGALRTALIVLTVLILGAVVLLYLGLKFALIQPALRAAESIERWEPIELGPMASRISELQLLASRYNAMLGDATTRIDGLDRKARVDALTGLANRQSIEQQLAAELRHQNGQEAGLSLLMFDIDHFKRVNDTYGHLTGDQVLRELTALARGHVRRSDSIGRWGGEEFLVICRGADAAGGERVAEELRQRIEASRFQPVGQLTCSFGVAECAPGDTPESLFQRADAALYEAKAAGRNRVRVGQC